MRYSLRTLFWLTILGPPFLAGAWLYSPVIQAAIRTITVRDILWLTFIAGLVIGWWIRQRRAERRIDALATRIHKIRVE